MLEFTVSKEAEHEPALRQILEAHLSCEHTSARRSFYIHLLALVSVFVWLGAPWVSCVLIFYCSIWHSTASLAVLLPSLDKKSVNEAP